MAKHAVITMLSIFVMLFVGLFNNVLLLAILYAMYLIVCKIFFCKIVRCHRCHLQQVVRHRYLVAMRLRDDLFWIYLFSVWQIVQMDILIHFRDQISSMSFAASGASSLSCCDNAFVR